MTNSGAVMAHHVKKMEEKIIGLKGKRFDIQDLFFRLTIDVFSEVAFGLQLNRFA